MSNSPAFAQPSRSVSPFAATLPAVVALPLVVAGAILLGSAVGAGLPYVEVVVTAGWAQALFFATGTYLLFDGGRMLIRLLLRGPEPMSAEVQQEKRGRLRLLGRARALAWLASLCVLTLALPLGGAHVVRGYGLFMAAMVGVLIVLSFLSVVGSLLGSGSMDASAAQWIIPSRTLEKLEAGAGLRGRATIDAMHQTGWMVNDNPQVHLELTVSVAGREPYKTRVTETVPLLVLGHLVRGKTVPVLVDADAPEHLLIQWTDL